MILVEMFSRSLWSYQFEDEQREFTETCEAAVVALMARGVKRAGITIDYEKETSRTRARETAARFVKAYGKDGARFMARGKLIGEECPVSEGEKVRRALRKTPLTCPHCNKPIRMDDWK